MKAKTCITFAKKCLTLLALISICFSLTGCAPDYSSTYIADYAIYANEVAYADLHLPFGASLGDYSSVRINRRPVKNIFFETMNSITLIVYYDGDSFSDAVNAVGSRYEFITEPPEGMSEVSADVNGITFKVVDNDSSHYPWWFMSVGVDTEKQRIIYLYHVDIETQKIEDLEIFIKDSYNLDGI